MRRARSVSWCRRPVWERVQKIFTTISLQQTSLAKRAKNRNEIRAVERPDDSVGQREATQVFCCQVKENAMTREMAKNNQWWYSKSELRRQVENCAEIILRVDGRDCRMRHAAPDKKGRANLSFTFLDAEDRDYWRKRAEAGAMVDIQLGASVVGISDFESGVTPKSRAMSGGLPIGVQNIHTRFIYACDVGSTKQNNFGWGRLGPVPRARPPIMSRCICRMVNRIARDLMAGASAALGIEAPCFLPVPANKAALSSARTGEGNRPWSAPAGAAVTT